MDTWQDRLKAERKELAEKLAKLNQFIADDENLKNIPNKQVALLISQAYAMNQYLEILDMRLSYVD